MYYKYRYKFVITGVSYYTNKVEFLGEIAQERNMSIDSVLYKIIKTECNSHINTHYGIQAVIYLTNKSLGIDEKFVGIFFFDKFSSCSHRAVAISDALGENRYWAYFNWKV